MSEQECLLDAWLNQIDQAAPGLPPWWPEQPTGTGAEAPASENEPSTWYEEPAENYLLATIEQMKRSVGERFWPGTGPGANSLIEEYLETTGKEGIHELNNAEAQELIGVLEKNPAGFWPNYMPTQIGPEQAFWSSVIYGGLKGHAASKAGVPVARAILPRIPYTNIGGEGLGSLSYASHNKPYARLLQEYWAKRMEGQPTGVRPSATKSILGAFRKPGTSAGMEQRLAQELAEMAPYKRAPTPGTSVRTGTQYTLKSKAGEEFLRSAGRYGKRWTPITPVQARFIASLERAGLTPAQAQQVARAGGGPTSLTQYVVKPGTFQGPNIGPAISKTGMETRPALLERQLNLSRMLQGKVPMEIKGGKPVTRAEVQKALAAVEKQIREEGTARVIPRPSTERIPGGLYRLGAAAPIMYGAIPTALGAAGLAGRELASGKAREQFFPGYNPEGLTRLMAPLPPVSMGMGRSTGEPDPFGKELGEAYKNYTEWMSNLVPDPNKGKTPAFVPSPGAGKQEYKKEPLFGPAGEEIGKWAASIPSWLGTQVGNIGKMFKQKPTVGAPSYGRPSGTPQTQPGSGVPTPAAGGEASFLSGMTLPMLMAAAARRYMKPEVEEQFRSGSGWYPYTPTPAGAPFGP